MVVSPSERSETTVHSTYIIPTFRRYELRAPWKLPAFKLPEHLWKGNFQPFNYLLVCKLRCFMYTPQQVLSGTAFQWAGMRWDDWWLFRSKCRDSPNCAQEFWATGKKHMFNTINVHVQYIAEADGLTFGPGTPKDFEHICWFLRIILDEKTPSTWWIFGDSKIHESSVIFEIHEPHNDKATNLEFKFP